MSAGLDPYWTSVLVSKPESLTPFPLPLTEERITVVVALKENAIDTDLTDLLSLLDKLDSTDCKQFLLISSSLPPWEQLLPRFSRPSLPLYWTTDTWVSSAHVYVLKGKEMLHRLSTVPADIKPYLRRPVCTLGQLAKKIANGDTEELMAAYCEVNAREEAVGEAAIGEVLALLGKRLGVNLSSAGEWFSTHKNPGGAEDIIHPREITFKQFIGRLHSYCELNNPKHSPTASLEHDPLYQVSLWQSRINALESQVQSLRSELASKTNTIVRLQQELKRTHSQISNSSPEHRETSPMESSGTEPPASMFLMHRPQGKQKNSKVHAKPKRTHTLHEGL